MLNIETRRNHRLNQNRISAMKCRQKKKQQFMELQDKKDALEASNLELKEKVSLITFILCSMKTYKSN